MNYQVTDESRFPHITALLTAHGHSPDQAADIVLHARHNYAPARQWIKVLAGAAAAHDRYQQALGLPFPLGRLTILHTPRLSGLHIDGLG
jgi:hypothetical protein